MTNLDPRRTRSSFANTSASILLVASAFWCVLWFFHSLHYWEDDSFIHLEFARSLTEGHGFSFNGHVVYGDTSPLWVFLLVAFHALIPGWIAAGKVLAVCGVLFACCTAFFFARKLTGNRLFAASMVLVFVTNPYFNYWAFSGMETITAAGLAMWGALLVSDRLITWPRFFIACLIAGIGPIARPEMVFLSAILGILIILRWSQKPGPIPAKIAALFAGLILAVGPTVAWSLYALHTFGRLIPNTNAAKRAPVHEIIPVRIGGIYAMGFPIVLIAIVAVIAVLAMRLARRQSSNIRIVAQTLPVAGWIFIVWSSIATLFYIVDRTEVQTRYIFVTASGLTITVLAILFIAAPRLQRQAIAFTAFIAIVLSAIATWPLVRNKGIADDDIRTGALWVHDNLPPNAPVAIYSIGEFAFVSRHPIIDTGGITMPGAVQYQNGNDIALEHWAHQAGAAYIVSSDPPEPGATLVYSDLLPVNGWSLNPRYYRRKNTYRIWKLPALPQ